MSEQIEYTIQRGASGWVLRGSGLSRPSVFDSEAKAQSLARTLIGGKSGGGYITGPNGERELYQGTRHLSQDGIQR